MYVLWIAHAPKKCKQMGFWQSLLFLNSDIKLIILYASPVLWPALTHLGPMTRLPPPQDTLSIIILLT